MIKPLETIMEHLTQRRFAASLHLAEQCMMRAGLTTQDLGRLQRIICRCRIQLGDHLGALSAGHVAERLTRDDAELRETRAQVLLDLTEIYLYLGRYQEAIDAGLEAIDGGLFPGETASEAACWRNLGIGYKRLGRFAEAIQAFLRARELLDPADADGLVTLRSYLVKAHAAAGTLDPIPALLAESESYLNEHPEDAGAKVAHLWDAAEYQFALGHRRAAAELAELALSFAERYSWHRYHCHMLLGRIALASGYSEDALRHVMTARAIAMQGHHFDLEAAATEMMYTLIRRHPEAVNGDGPSRAQENVMQQGARAH